YYPRQANRGLAPGPRGILTKLWDRAPRRTWGPSVDVRWTGAGQRGAAMAERSPGERFGALATSRRGFLRAASALGAAGLAAGVVGPPRGQAAPLATMRGVLRGRVD